MKPSLYARCIWLVLQCVPRRYVGVWFFGFMKLTGRLKGMPQ